MNNRRKLVIALGAGARKEAGLNSYPSREVNMTPDQVTASLKIYGGR